MAIQDVLALSPAVAMKIDRALASLERLWNGDAAGSESLDALLGGLVKNWAGYGVTLSDSNHPRVRLFLRSVPENPALLRWLAQWTGLSVEVRRPIRFRSLGGGAPAAPTVSVRPGDRICSSGGSQALGSIGAFLEGASGRYLLSANHVIAANGDLAQDRVLTGDTVVAHNIRFVEIFATTSNRVDMAVAECEAGLAIDPRFGGLALASTAPTTPVRPSTRIRTISPGRSTEGRLDSFCPRLEIGIPECEIPLAPFVDQLLIANHGAVPFSEEGDSGSLALAGPDNKLEPLGMLIANGADPVTGELFTVVSPFATVMDAAAEAAGEPLTLLA